MFINLHVHDCKGSIRDAIAKPKEIANKVAELGQLGYASTNHGSASSLLTHYNICKSKNLKFVFGIEAYICDYISIREKYDYKHICLFAKDMTGYQNILKLVSISYDKGFYYKPRIDWDILMQHKDGLIVSSACLGGILGIKDSNGNFDKLAILNTAEKYKKAFGDDFYIEIQTNQMSEQIEFNKLLIDLCHNLQIPFIATCDSHYVNKEDAWIHRHWNGIDDNEENGYYQTDDFYIHSEGDVVRALQYLNGVDVQCAIYNTVELFNKCNVVLPEGEDNFPIFECKSQVEKVKEICRVGWKNKIMGIIPKDKQQVYLDRFLEEMDILEKANYLNMMLITWDYMKWGREQGIRFGSGRGSVGGSLVAYLMDLTKVDPVANNLIFSRFCNLERVTVADIDTDVEQRSRGKVINYLREKYGYVYQVRTFSAMKAKSALQKAGMCLGVEPSVIRALSKLLSDVAGKESEETAKFDDIPITKDNEQLIKLAKAFVGIISNTGVHASAVLVFPKDPTLFCTLEKQGDILVASYDYHELEELGLAKIDVLGLKNMDIIEDTIQLLAERGIVVDIDKIPLDDKKTSEMLCRKETDGVFQIESKIMKGIVNGIQPTCFQDLTAVVALGRPGPLQSGMVEEYINERKHFIKKNN